MKKSQLRQIIKEEISKALKESVNEGYEDQLFLKSKMKQAFLEGWKSAQLPTQQTDIKAFENFWRKQS